MAHFRQKFLRPGRYELAGGRHQTLTASDLRRIAENTRRLLARGYRIPVLTGHGVPGSADAGPRPAASPASGAIAGRLFDVWQDADGALVQVIEVPDEAVVRLESGRLAHTSPELRPRFVDSQGRDYGPVIAHVALTRRPRDRKQAPLARVEENDVALSRQPISDSQPLPKPPNQGVLPMSQAATVGEVAGETASDVANEPQNVTTSEIDRESANEIAGELERDARCEIAGETACETQTAAPESAVAPESNEAPSDAEAEIVPARRIDRQQFRQQLTRRILASQKLPRGLRERLAAAVEAVQLSQDGSEEPTLRVSDAVTMIEESLPPQLALAADELERPGHPHGEIFFTGDARSLSDQEAARIAREQLTSVGLLPRRGRAAE